MHPPLHDELAKLQAGDHLCLIYETCQEQLAATIPFIQQGLAAQHCCLWVLGELSEEDVCAALQVAGTDPGTALARGALRFLRHPASGSGAQPLDPAALLRHLAYDTQEARRAGFKALRITGEMTCCLGSAMPSANASGSLGTQALRYEELANHVFPQWETIVICQYHRRRFPAATLQSILQAHPHVITRGRLCANPYYEPPQFISSDDPAARRLDWRLQQIFEAHLAKEELAATTAQLQAQTQQLRLIADTMPTLLCYVDREHRYRFANEAYKTWFNIDTAHVIGQHLKTILGKQVYAKIAPYLARCLAGEAVEFEFEAAYQYGGTRSVHAIYSPDKNEADEVCGLVIIVKDISDRKRVERALQESNSRIRAIFAQVNIGVLQTDAQGHLRYANHYFCKLLGRTQDEMLGMALTSLVHPDDLAATEDYLTSALDLNRCGTLDQRYMRPQGEAIWAATSVSPVRPSEESEAIGLVGVVYDISKRKKAEESLRESEERFRSIFELAAIGHTVTDPWSHRLLQVNRRFCQISGYNEHELLGRPLSELMDPADRAAELKAFHELLHGHLTHQQTEVRLQRSDGTRIWVAINTTVLHRKNRDCICLLSAFDDITLRKQAEEKMRLAKEAAETANRLKTAFLANMSHEIRSPLNAILGFSQLLREEGLSSDEHSVYADIIERNASALNQLINDILDLSRVEAGRMSFERYPTSLGSLLSDVLGSLAGKAREKGLALTIDAVGLLPELIYTDRGRLRQILMNILGNAIKFTHKGSVHIAVQLSQCPDSRLPQLRFRVEDTGCGISQEAQSRLFQAFTQGDASSTRTFGGTGLGLCLARKLARGLGGNVELLKSQADQGSVFLVSIDPGPLSPNQALRPLPAGLGVAPAQAFPSPGVAPLQDHHTSG